MNWVPSHSGFVTATYAEEEIVRAETEGKQLQVDGHIAQEGNPSIYAMFRGPVISYGFDSTGKRYFDIKIGSFYKSDATPSQPNLPALGTIVRLGSDNLSFIGRSL